MGIGKTSGSTLHQRRVILLVPPRPATWLPCAWGTILLCLRFPLSFPLCFFVLVCHLAFDDQPQSQLDASWLPLVLVQQRLGRMNTQRHGGAGSLIKTCLCVPTWASGPRQEEQYYLGSWSEQQWFQSSKQWALWFYSIFLLRTRSHGPHVPGGLEKDELPGLTRDASATGVKTQQLLWSRLASPRHGPSQPFHIKIRVMMLSNLDNSHTLGSRTSQHATEMSGLRTLFLIHLPWVRVWVCSPSKPWACTFSRSKIHCAVHQKEKRSPRERTSKNSSLWSL